MKKVKSLLVLLILLFSTLIYSLEFSVNSDYSRYNLIYAQGRIVKGDLFRLKRVYYKLPRRRNKQTIVVFKSVGGELEEGIRIGKFLKRHGIGSAVSSNSLCVSSCAIAFLGGRDKYGKKLRVLPENSKLGYHFFYYKNNNYVDVDEFQRVLTKLVKYFKFVDAPQSLVYKMLSTNHTDMFWISNRSRILKVQKGIRRVAFHIQSKPQLNYYSKSKRRTKRRRSRKRKQPKFASKKEYMKYYFSQVNDIIQANSTRDGRYVVLNTSNDYYSWLGANLKYVYVSSIRNIGKYEVKAKVTYAFRNGMSICSENTYRLTKRGSRWKISTKKLRGCTYKARRVIRELKHRLP